MSLPNPSAAVSLRKPEHQYRASAIQTSEEARGSVQPQQWQWPFCSTDHGNCTGFGGVSTASADGFTQTCTAPFQYPWVQVCRNPWTGGTPQVNRGCGICLW